MMDFKKDKKGIALSLQTIFVIAVVSLGTFFLASWFMGFGGGQPQTLAVQQTPSGQAVQQGQAVQPISLVEDVTVTFSSFDQYAVSTNAETAHRILRAGDGAGGGDINIVVADDGTKTYSPGQSYQVLIGNVTTSLTANTDYYPVYTTGVFPDKGTYTVQSGQALAGGASQVTFTFKNDVDQVNTAVALSTNDKKTVKWILRAADNVCIGNPTVNGLNGMSYTYNNSLYNKVVQLNENSADQTAISVPTSITAVVGKRTATYTFPIVCDNAEVTRQVRLETGATQPDGTDDNVNMTVSDITIDYDADTLELIGGIGSNGKPNGAYEDEDNNDIGVADFALPGLTVS